MRFLTFLIAIAILFISCDSKYQYASEAKAVYSSHKDEFKSVINLLSKIIEQNRSIFVNCENIICISSNRNKNSEGKIENSRISEFLKRVDFTEIHIYNKSNCDEQVKAFQTFVFENERNVALQFDKCERLAPALQGNSFKNSRVLMIRADRNWIAVYQKN